MNLNFFEFTSVVTTSRYRLGLWQSIVKNKLGLDGLIVMEIIME